MWQIIRVLRPVLPVVNAVMPARFFFERSVFDPQWIFRMVNLGLEEEILKSPSIWLCLACQRCTEACGELVSGHLIIQRLQELALEEGMVDKDFPYRWKSAQKASYIL